PVRLTGPFVGAGLGRGESTFAFAGDRVLYLAEQNVAGEIDLYSAPLDGSASAARVHPPLVSGGDVTSFLVSPDGSFVLLLADGLVDERFELFRAPSDGSGGAFRLNAPLAPGEDVGRYLLSADGAWMLYFRRDS